MVIVGVLYSGAGQLDQGESSVAMPGISRFWPSFGMSSVQAYLLLQISLSSENLEAKTLKTNVSTFRIEGFLSAPKLVIIDSVDGAENMIPESSQYQICIS